MAKTKLAAPLTSEWKDQINDLLVQQRTVVDLNVMYKKLFLHYYIGRYDAPHFTHPNNDPKSKEWGSVYWYLSDAHRRACVRFSTKKT